MTRDEKYAEVADRYGLDTDVLTMIVDDLVELGAVKPLEEPRVLRININPPGFPPGMCAGFPPPPDPRDWPGLNHNPGWALPARPERYVR